MRTSTIVVGLATCTATTLASVAPRHKTSLWHRGLHARQVWGQCAVNGVTCGQGYCCSKYNYCGVTPDYCGAGCNPQFGTCSNTTETTETTETNVPDTSAPAPQSQSTGPAAQSSPAAPTTGNDNNPPSSNTPDTGYTQFLGTGSTGPTTSSSGFSDKDAVDGTSSSGNNWPSESSWLPFEDLWDQNYNTIMTSELDGPANTQAETNAIQAAINTSAQSTGLDPRFILAIMMQESKGCAHVDSTLNPDGVSTNPGLFQSAGTASCGQGECDSTVIDQMFAEGVAGTGNDNGLLQCYQLASTKLGLSGAQQYYAAARLYNSGQNSLQPGGNLGAPGATPCYSSDIANRLIGWGGNGGKSPCTLTN